MEYGLGLQVNIRWLTQLSTFQSTITLEEVDDEIDKRIVWEFTGFATGEGHIKRRLSGLRHDDKMNKIDINRFTLL